jgi:response regulator of citrate/malate metabolism
MTMNILIVEDCAPVRERLLDLLACVTGNKIIRTEATLSLGLECVKSAWPKLVILGIHLPDWNAIGSISLTK